MKPTERNQGGRAATCYSVGRWTDKWSGYVSKRCMSDEEVVMIQLVTRRRVMKVEGGALSLSDGPWFGWSSELCGIVECQVDAILA